MPDRSPPTPTPVVPSVKPTDTVTRGTEVTGGAATPAPLIDPAAPTVAAYPFLGPPVQPGDLGTLGPYRVIRLLGEGGMGYVFRGEDDTIQRPVALKVMKPEIAARPRAKDRFLREGRAAGKLKSDHVTVIHFVGEHAGVPFLAMEFLDGMTLDQWLSGRPVPVPIAGVVRVARDVLKGLAAAHEKGLVHRDIKPANLWCEQSTGRIKVLDFGLTRGTGEEDKVTAAGAVLGTPSYMAPEQAEGEPTDARADLFSLGVVLYRMLTGSSPFARGGVLQSLAALATYDPPPLTEAVPGTPADLSAFVAKLIAKNPAERPNDARAALAELSVIERRVRTEMATKPPVPVPELPNAPSTSKAVVVPEPPRIPVPPSDGTIPLVPAASRKRSKTGLRIALGLLGLIAMVAAGVIVIKITNKDGSVTELKLPDGTQKVEVIDDGKTVAVVPPPPKPTEPVPVVPGAKEEPIDYASERKAAEKIIATGQGFLSLKTDKGETYGHTFEKWRTSKLPELPFHVYFVQFYAGTTDGHLTAVAGFSRVEGLTFTERAADSVTDAGWKALKGFRRLTILSLGRSPIGDDGISFVRDCPALVDVDLMSTKVTDAGLEHLRACPGLRSFRAPPAMTDIGFARVVTACREIRSVNIPYSVSLKPLADLPRVQEVSCHGLRVTEEGAGVLIGLPFLTRLHLDYPPPGVLKRLLPLGNGLPKLSIRSQIIDYPVRLEDWLPVTNFSELQDLHLNGNVFVDDAALARVADMPRLRAFHIGLDAQIAPQFTADGVAAFRRRRPDVRFSYHDRKEGQTFPLLDVYPRAADGKSLAPWDLPKDAPPPAVVPFPADVAKKHQDAWAAFTKLPVEAASKATGMKFRLIPPGDFVTELPDKRAALVRVTKPYYLGATEVTVGQFKKFVEATGYKTAAEAFNVTWRSPGYPLADDLPVNFVTGSDCRAFCEWLSREDGVVYRLPTDAEWHLAARGGHADRWLFGSAAQAAQHGWFRDNISASMVQPTAKKPSNPFGLFDVVGNVWEYAYSTTSAVRSAEVGNPVGSHYLIHGYSYKDSADGDISGFGNVYDYPNPNVGFRVLRQTTNDPPPNPYKLSEKPLLVGKGQPLSPQATVNRPAAIPGVRSWSIEPASHNWSVGSVAWSPKGDLLATAGNDDHSVRLWDRSGKLKAVLLGHEAVVTSVSFSADGALLASCESIQAITAPWRRGSVRVWDTATGACRFALPTPGECETVAFSPAGRRLTAFGYFGASVFDLDTGAAVLIDRTKVGGDHVCWSPDGKWLFGNGGQSMGVWDAATGALIGECQVPDWPDRKPRETRAVGWSLDGKWLAAGSDDGNVRIWDAKTREHQRSVATGNGRVDSLAWGRAGRVIAGCQGLGLGVIDPQAGTITGKSEPGTFNVFSVSVSPDGAEVAYHMHHDRPRFADTMTGKEIRKAANEKGRFRYSMNWPAFLPNGRLRVGFGDTAGVREFDPETGALLTDHGRDRPGFGNYSATAPDGSWDLYGWDGKASIVPLGAATPSVQFAAPGAWPFRADPTGQRVAAPAGTAAVVWSVKGVREREFPHPAKVVDVAWSPDGGRLATSCDDKVVRFWDAATGKMLAESPVLSAAPNVPSWASATLAWEPDGRSVWVGLIPGIVRVDTGTGRSSPLEGYNNGGGPTAHLALARDGDSLLVAEGYRWTYLRTPQGERRLLGLQLGTAPAWHPDARRFLGENWGVMHSFDTWRNQRLGTLYPRFGENDADWACVGPDGHWRGSAGVTDHLVYVAMLEDGSQKTYTPAEFEKVFGWKNDPTKARLLKFDP